MSKEGSGKGKMIGSGLIGGLIGGLLIGGLGYSMLKNDSLSLESQQKKTTGVTYQVSSDVTTMVDEVKGSVVSVINLRSGGQTLKDLLAQEGEQKEAPKEVLQSASEGSGVIYKISGKDAYVVTNHHVIAGADALEVLLKDGTTVQAEIVGADVFTDLAVLKMPSQSVEKAAEFADSSKVQVGEPAIAIGSPLGSGYANSVTQGIVSATERTITNKTEDGQLTSINAIQTDAAINPGNSGGALLNIKGQVIGINSVKIAEASVEGMGFAIPSNDVLDIITALEADGEIKRPQLGIVPYNLYLVTSETRQEVLKISDDLRSGVVILEITKGSPAEKAQLLAGDVIVAIDGKAVTNNIELQTILYQQEIGDQVEVEFYRGTDKQTATVKLTD